MAKKSTGAVVALLGVLGIGFLALAPTTATAAPKPSGGSGGGPLPPAPPAPPGPFPAPQPTPSPPSGPSGPVVGGCQLDPGLASDPTTFALFNQTLNSTTLSPADYESVAQTADSAGYPMAAACLRQKGAAVKLQQQVNLDTRGGMPFTIRTGDIPYLLAQYYTGDPSRFPDLGQLNPQLGQLQTVNGVSNYPGWVVGAQILIPKSWNPLDKPIPPTAQ